MASEPNNHHHSGNGRARYRRYLLSEMEGARMINWLLDLLSPGDRVRHMTLDGGVENGGTDIVYEKSDQTNGSLVTRGGNGEPVWTRVKWTYYQAKKP